MRLTARRTAPAPQEPVGTAHKSRRRTMRRGMLALLLVGICGAGVFAGTRLAPGSAEDHLPPLPDALIAGDWELHSINGYPVGPETESVILSQHIHFQQGRLRGMTCIRSERYGANTSLPLPSEIVTEVRGRVGGHGIRILWDGCYRMLPNRRIEMRIGKGVYRMRLLPDPQKQTLDLEQDPILTYKGLAHYRMVTGKASEQIVRLP